MEEGILVGRMLFTKEQNREIAKQIEKEKEPRYSVTELEKIIDSYQDEICSEKLDCECFIKFLKDKACVEAILNENK